MSRNGTKRKTAARRDKRACERLKAALAISKLLRLYGLYAENHGFDNAIMEAGIRALECEIRAVLNTLGDKENGKRAFPEDQPICNHAEDLPKTPV